MSKDFRLIDFKDEIQRSSSQIQIFTDVNDRKKYSKDFYDYSPILFDILKNCCADIVLRPRSVDDIILIAKLCNKYSLPLTIRGSGTGNYGQCVPLNNGVVMIMNSINRIRHLNEGSGETFVESGCLMRDLEFFLRENKRQLRLMPSTWRSSTIGGFIAGGAGGIGSVKWGFLRDPGNLLGLEIITLEKEPKKIFLDMKDAEPLNHGYGTNGVITALKLSTAREIQWHEIIVEFDDIRYALEFMKLCTSAAIDINLCTFIEDKIVKSLPNIKDNNRHLILFLVDEIGKHVIFNFSKQYQANILYENIENINSGKLIREFSWNHTTLHMRNYDKSWTYLQMLLPKNEIEFINHFKQKWKDKVLWHLEAVRQTGEQRLAALPLVDFESEDQINELIVECKSMGAIIFNPHVITVEDGGLGVVDSDQVRAKSKYDPNGLLNQGKLKGWDIS